LWAEPPPPLDANSYAIVGSGYATATQINDDDEAGCAELASGNGDGTVPVKSATASSWIPQTNVWYVNEQHVGLPSNPAVIEAISAILQGGIPTSLSLLPTQSPTTETSLCSPVQASAVNSMSQVEGPNSNQINGAQYLSPAGSSAVWVPTGDNYTLNLTGTGTGTFTAIVKQVDGDGNPLQTTKFNNVPVKPSSTGNIVVTGNNVSQLAYDYTGKGVFDTIPANVTPPVIQSTGAYFLTQGVRATVAFNVGYLGAVSTFAYNFRSSRQVVQFASTTTSQISVTGNTATFVGLGAVNGQTGYTFSVTATDGGPPGSGLDSISISITGPNNYGYAVSANILGGDIVVNP
jgi:hypothetical protein